MMYKFLTVNDIGKLTPGTQVAYVPTHADLDHPDVEFGFVTSANPSGTVFVRYFYNPAKHTSLRGLRTKGNSEPTTISDLVLYDHMPQETINTYLNVL